MNPRYLKCTSLISACAHDRCNDILWREFMRRNGRTIRQFVRGTCILWASGTGRNLEMLPRAIEENDLVQEILLRLIENDCTAMKAFSGRTPREWLVYLAVITRSVVCDTFRRHRRQKRSGSTTPFAISWGAADINKRNQHLEMDKLLLAEEVRAICERSIRYLAGEHADRNILVFNLYFFHNLSVRQIAACRGVALSKTEVARILDRLRHLVRTEIGVNLAQVEGMRSRRRQVASMDRRQRERESWPTKKLTRAITPQS